MHQPPATNENPPDQFSSPAKCAIHPAEWYPTLNPPVQLGTPLAALRSIMRATSLLQTSPYLLIESLKSRINVVKRTQKIEVAHANKMQSTLKHLGLFDNNILKDEDLLPLCYHFAYFLPQLSETDLGPDGADKTFNAGDPYTRRMWAGGRLSWNAENPLRIGQTIEETTSLDKAESKKTRDGKTMIVVTGKKEYHNANGLALIDRRSWLFREPDTLQLDALQSKSASPPQSQKKSVLNGTQIGTVKASEVTLFRYSALTFNSHKIHYDREWCRDVEGQRDLVVHGPLNITLIANMWLKTFGTAPSTLVYKATSPCYVNEEYYLMHNDNSIWLKGQDGRIIMSARHE